jgi:hypothetical protein
MSARKEPERKKARAMRRFENCSQSAARRMMRAMAIEDQRRREQAAVPRLPCRWTILERLPLSSAPPAAPWRPQNRPYRSPRRTSRRPARAGRGPHPADPGRATAGRGSSSRAIATSSHSVPGQPSRRAGSISQLQLDQRATAKARPEADELPPRTIVRRSFSPDRGLSRPTPGRFWACPASCKLPPSAPPGPGVPLPACPLSSARLKWHVIRPSSAKKTALCSSRGRAAICRSRPLQPAAPPGLHQPPPGAIDRPATRALARDRPWGAGRFVAPRSGWLPVAPRIPRTPGLPDAVKRLRTQILKLEQVTQQSLRPRRNDHLSRLCRGLQPGGEIEGVADHDLFLRCALANQITHDDHACGNADSSRQRIARRDPESGNGPRRRQTRAHRPLRCILMGAWPTEICQDAVPHEFGDVAPKTQDFARNGILIDMYDVAHVLGLESRRQLG